MEKEIDFSNRFDKEIRKAGTKISKKFKRRIAMFLVDQENPLLRNHGLVGKWKGCRSINITGDWRAVYVVEKDRIIFVALGTHSQLYG